ncbi:MAG TPA: tripartite tricarboxylate transporter substrate binding protein [Burkholderiales bacterium]|nr:tripartite tricarboxylate transporter substrate binding protein [Burkholderiales bacterium]
MKLIAAAAAALCVVLSPFSQAQTYPTRSVSLVVPFSAGGGTDIVARLLAQKLSESLKGTVVVDNRPGASAQIGTKYVVDAAPDGHTLLVGTTSLVNGPALFGKKLPYDHNKQLRPVISLADLAIFLSVNAQKFSAKTVKEFIEQAKKMPNLNMGSAGPGTTLHMSAEWFKLATGLPSLHVPFKGSAPQVVALGGGQVDWAMENFGAVLPMVQNGRVRLLAVASHARHPQAPDVPTFKEAGLPDVNLSTWIFLMAPAATPDAIVTRLNTTIREILRTQDMQDKLLQQGFVQSGGTVAELAARMKAETELWGKVIREANIKLD